MNVHTDADDIHAHAQAFRVMETVDRRIMRDALQTTYGEMLTRRDRLDAEIETGLAKIAEIQHRINAMALERSEAHRGVVRSAAQLSALEAQEGR